MKQRRRSTLFSVIILVVLVLGIFRLSIWYDNNSRAVPSVSTQPSQFLLFPFREGVDVRLAEGWIYSDEEQKIHGRKIHYASDLAAPRGTPVYAAADGLAIASFDTQDDGEYQGKRIGFGYGRFVQVWSPETSTYTIYSHLEEIAPGIYYEEPTKTETGWVAELPISKEEAEEHESTPIKQGDLIGYVGDSGLTWGYEETPENRPNPTEFPSWDETHLHFEVFRYDSDGKKVAYDPYGIYEQAEKYGERIVTDRTLWLRNESGQFRKPAGQSSAQSSASPSPTNKEP